MIKATAVCIAFLTSLMCFGAEPVDTICPASTVADASVGVQCRELMELVTADSVIFTKSIPAGDVVPVCLRAHLTAVADVQSMITSLIEIEAVTAQVNHVYRLKSDYERGTYVKEAIEPLMEALAERIGGFKSSGGEATFSEAQRLYVRNKLINPYNSIIDKYFSSYE